MRRLIYNALYDILTLAIWMSTTNCIFGTKTKNRISNICLYV